MKIMKTKILRLVAFGVITFATIYSCSLSDDSVLTVNDNICSNYSTLSTLEVKLIHEMISGYKLNQLTAINNNAASIGIPLPSGDARAIWFDLETLKAFIYQIELKASKNQPSIPDTELGIRIYYANYPYYQNWNNYPDLLAPGGSNVLPQNYEKRHTLVMIPTIRIDGLDVDFNPIDPLTYSENPLPTNSNYSAQSTTRAVALTGTSSSSQNHGSLIPPGNPGQNGF